MSKLEKIISGGQTGVDRGALDAALGCGFRCGGWCPRGRRAEDGPIPERYPLTELEGSGYPERTERNVREADATLVLTRGAPSRGTALTVSFARRLRTPCLVLDLAAQIDLGDITRWLEGNGVRVLNVAGPRESQLPGASAQARQLLEKILAEAT